ncbi:MAG: S8 family serine peptidase [Planctomycetota bacterium]
MKQLARFAAVALLCTVFFAPTPHASVPATGRQAQDEVTVLLPPVSFSNETQLEAINALDAHAAAFLGAGQTIAIVDAFVDTDMIEESRVVEHVDLLSVPSSFDSGHGTAVTAVAMEVAPEASFLLYRAIDDDGVVDLDAAVTAIHDAVAAGATVINLSFVTATDYGQLHQAIKIAHALGIHVVAAVGPESLGSAPYPASYPEVIGVSSVELASNGGFQLVDEAYHGAAVEFLAQGETVVVPHGPAASGLALGSGTSFAAPFVAGGCALVRAANPGLWRDEVTEILAHAVQRAARTAEEIAAGHCDAVIDLEPAMLQ